MSSQSSPGGVGGPADLLSSRSAGNLPFAVTSFVGREQELSEGRRLLQMTRLLTLTGAGGVGKTRLALEVARQARVGYPDGVWLVELASLTDGHLVPHAVARSLGVQDQPGRPITDALTTWLADRRLLLVLDNCEHLLDACARLVGAVLATCPDVRVLATSREAVGVGGELTWRVPSLDVPDDRGPPSVAVVEQAAAAQLFVARASFARPGFRLTSDNVAAVARICRRLDGIPLAIELAAARVPLLTVEQLTTRLNDAIRLLTGGSRTAPPRQQTLRAAIDWSYGLLEERERILFRRLAVFAGGWTLEAMEAVCAGGSIEQGDVLELLGQLVAKSLAQVEPGKEPRYRLLETVRQYAWEWLREAGDEQTMRGRHAQWCLALGEQGEAGIRGPEQPAWLARLEADHDNLRAALVWCFDHDARAGLRLAGRLTSYWGKRAYYHEGRQWLERLLERVPDRTIERANALFELGVLAREQGDFATTRACDEEALALSRELGDRPWTALMLCELGTILFFLGEHQQARARLEEALPIAREVEDQWLGWLTLGATMAWLGWLAEAEGDYRQARRWLEENLALTRAAGHLFHVSRALWLLGRVPMAQGDYEQARRMFEEGLALAEAITAPQRIAILRWHLGQVAYLQGDLEQAGDLFAASLTQAREVADHRDVAWALVGLGQVARQRGELTAARTMLAESLTLFTTFGYKQGRGVALHALGLTSWADGDAARAMDQLRESLRLRQAMGERLGIAECLEGLAMVIAGRQPTRAARLLGAAAAIREAIGAPLPPIEQPTQRATARGARAALGEQAFATAWAAGRALTVEQAISHALSDDGRHADVPANAMDRPVSALGNLTPREVEALRLLAQGKTNREIAAELSISVKTVNKHVASVLGKTGSPNRTAAAAFALRQGLG